MSEEAPKRAKEFPIWLKKPWPAQYDLRTHRILDDLKLNTVCQSAECPNLGECWSRGAATFMILGENCTRSCNFCAVKTGRGESLEKLADEPARVAQATKQLGLEARRRHLCRARRSKRRRRKSFRARHHHVAQLLRAGTGYRSVDARFSCARRLHQRRWSMRSPTSSTTTWKRLSACRSPCGRRAATSAR